MLEDGVLIFLNKIKYSGASKIALWVASSLSALYPVTVLTYEPADQTDGMAVSPSVRVEQLQCRTGRRRLVRFLTVTRSLSRYLSRHKPAVALSFHPLASLQLILAAGLCKAKVKVVVCERSDPWTEKTIVSTICRKAYRFADHAVFQTEEARDYYPDSLRKRSTVIPNPAFMTSTRIIPYAKRGNKIAHVARLFIRQKRQDILLEAFARCAERIPDAELYIYGDGPDETVIRDLVEKKGLADRVVLCGKTSRVTEEIADARLFVLSSDYEGIPNAVIEALSVGVPCVCTDCSPGGARMLIQDGENGYVVPRDDVEALADRIVEVYDDRQRAEYMANNAPDVLKRFSESAVAGIWSSMLQQITGMRDKENSV